MKRGYRYILLIMLVGLLRHEGITHAQERPTLTPIPPPTATPMPTDTPRPTATGYPTYTPYPTYTSEATETGTPYPTYTPYPTWTAEPTTRSSRPVLPTIVLPTQRPAPTQTSVPPATRTSRPTATPDWNRVHSATRQAYEKTQTAQLTPTPYRTRTARPTVTSWSTATPNQTATRQWEETRWAETKTARPTPTDTPTLTPTSTNSPTPTLTPNYRATQEERSRVWKTEESMKDEVRSMKEERIVTATPTPTVMPTITITPTVVMTVTGIPVEMGILERPTATPNAKGEIVAIVQPGDTAIGIAVQHQIDLDQLLAQNGMDRQSMIRPGDRLLVFAEQSSSEHGSQPQPMAAPTPEPMQVEMMPFSDADCQLAVEAFEDANGDKERQPGEGISDLLVLIIESQQAWTVKRYTDDGRIQLAVPCVSLELELPYLFRRRSVTKMELERGTVIQFVETAAVYPRMLP